MYKKHLIFAAIFAAVVGIIFLSLKTKDLASDVWKIEQVVLSALDKSGVKNRELVSRDVGKWRGIRLRGKTVKYIFEHAGDINHAAIKANIEKAISKMRAVDLKKAVYKKTPGKRPEGTYIVTFYTRPAVVVIVRGKTKVPIAKTKEAEAPKKKEVKPAEKPVVKPQEVKPKELSPVEAKPKALPSAEVTPKELPPVETKPKALPPAEVKPKELFPVEAKPKAPLPAEVKPKASKEIKPKPEASKENKPKAEAPKESKPKTEAPEAIKPKFSLFQEAKPKAPAPKTVKSKEMPPKEAKPKPVPVKVAPVKEVKSAPKIVSVIPEKPAGRIAIVLDDFGYTKNNLSALQAADIPVTMAILPNDPFTNAACEFARKNGFEVVLHMPMEPEDKNVGLEKSTILTTMDGRTIRQTIDKAFNSVLGAKGLNNHMGSKATRDKRVMRIVMETLKTKGKYFLDSRTTSDSAALAAAIEAGIPHVGRDIFLDAKPGREFVASQLMAAERLAGRGTGIVVIGHDRTDTINVLKEMAPEMKKRNVRFVKLSELVAR